MAWRVARDQTRPIPRCGLPYPLISPAFPMLLCPDCPDRVRTRVHEAPAGSYGDRVDHDSHKNIRGRGAHTAESAASGPGRSPRQSRVRLQMIGLALPPWIGAGCDSRDFRGRVSTLSGQSGQRLQIQNIDFRENGASRFDRFFLWFLLISHLTLG